LSSLIRRKLAYEFLLEGIYEFASKSQNHRRSFTKTFLCLD
jgi:hypothetical protein